MHMHMIEGLRHYVRYVLTLVRRRIGGQAAVLLLTAVGAVGRLLLY